MGFNLTNNQQYILNAERTQHNENYTPIQRTIVTNQTKTEFMCIILKMKEFFDGKERWK